ncbi:MAG: porin family protein [Desulfobacterales bacterium]|jgi:opacity protein-like surface antigen
MKKWIVLFLAVMVLLALSTNAVAGPAEKGFYLGGGLAYAWENFDDAGLNFDDAWGLNAFAGYRLMRYVALEGNFNWYDDFESDSFNVDVEIWTLMIDIKGMYPVYNDRLIPYLRAGLGYMDAEASAGGLDADEEDLAVNFGGGLGYYVTDQVSLGLDGKYVWGTGDLDDIEYFVGTVYVSYHF